MKKEIPVLFSFPMVEAIMQGRKTITRRIMKYSRDDKHKEVLFPGEIQETPDMWHPVSKVTPYSFEEGVIYDGDDGHCYIDFESKQIQSTNYMACLKCPYGKPGNILYVREAHYRYGKWIKKGTTKTGRQKWAFQPAGQFDNFRYQENKPFTVQKSTDRVIGWYKLPSLFMPKLYARLWLEVQGISVERLQDITRGDAMSEGCPFPNLAGKTNPVEWFSTLWQKINGKESWEENPWVWVISFKVLSTTGKPNL